MAALTTTHFPKLSPLTINESLVTNPVDTSNHDAQLTEIGLKKFQVLKPKYKQCDFYVSPASFLITPIWFMPTCIGWYWTPTDPNANDVDSNWMPVTTMAVVGGFWNGIMPASKNVKIIDWLHLNMKMI